VGTTDIMPASVTGLVTERISLGVADMGSTAGLALGLLVGCLVAVGFVAGIRARPSIVLTRVEQQMTALRADIDSYRAAQEFIAASLERRMDDLEQTTAQAANEVRMVSNEVMARLGAAPGVGNGEPR
jgi:hypothetical protein